MLAYFGVLFGISRLMARGSNNASFFTGNRNSPWYVVAFGMIGASLSGVTFLSVPGWVEGNQFAYMQMVLGYLAGYAVIAFILLPLYYRLNLHSIYTYFEHRFGIHEKKIGAGLFLVSRIMGAAFRLFLVAMVFQYAVFDRFDINMPFWLTIVVTVGLIWAYTAKSGIQAVVWTDTFQTLFMLLGAGFALYTLVHYKFDGVGEAVQWLKSSPHGQMLFWDDWKGGQFFVKQFLSGMFITIVMTGMDQDMMQKNLTCRSLKDAQKNMLTLGTVLIPVNFLFLALGAFLLHYAQASDQVIEVNPDQLFSAVALNGELGMAMAILFLLGLIAAAYSSADSALTSLTTTLCVDVLEVEKFDEIKQVKIRKWAHIVMSIVLILVILPFDGNESVIKKLFKWAAYTYGPLLGLFAFGMATKRAVKQSMPILPFILLVVTLIGGLYALPVSILEWKNIEGEFEFQSSIMIVLGLLMVANVASWVGLKHKGKRISYAWLAVIVAPVLTFVVVENSSYWFSGYTFSFEFLPLNGLLTFALLLLFSDRSQKV